MDKTLYDLMDWAGIEEIVYSEAANPHRMLGAHMTPEGMLVQAFIPTARDITVKLSATGKQYQMEMADETGFFAALIPRKTLADYTLLVFYDNGTCAMRTVGGTAVWARAAAVSRSAPSSRVSRFMVKVVSVRNPKVCFYFLLSNFSFY